MHVSADAPPPKKKSETWALLKAKVTIQVVVGCGLWCLGTELLALGYFRRDHALTLCATSPALHTNTFWVMLFFFTEWNLKWTPYSKLRFKRIKVFWEPWYRKYKLKKLQLLIFVQLLIFYQLNRVSVCSLSSILRPRSFQSLFTLPLHLC